MGATPTEHERRPPWFVLVAGINGAGKSTFAQNHATLRVLLEAQGPEIEDINPDLITREILRFEPRLPLEEANLRAADECARRVRDLAARDESAGLFQRLFGTQGGPS